VTQRSIVRSIVFIESNTTGTGEKFISSALSKGYNILFISVNPLKYSFLKKMLIQPIILDTSDIKVLEAYLKTISSIKAIISTSETYIQTASCLAELFSLCGTNPITIENCRNKYLLGKLLFKAGISNINTCFVKTVDEVDRILKTMALPVVIKPNVGTGSIGVKLCKTYPEAIEHCEALKSDFLIQEYIAGEEYSAEIVMFNNKYYFLGITKKYLGPEPYFVEIGHDFPALIESELKESVAKILAQAMKVVGFDFGPAHIEFRILNGKIYIIEINPRLAGGMIPILIEQSYQIKLIDSLIELYTGNEFTFEPNACLATKIKFILSDHEGYISKLNGFNEIKKQKNIVDAYSYKNIGDYITIKGDFSDRIGFVIAKGDNLDECEDSIASAYDKLDIEIITKSDIQESSINHARDRLKSPLDPRVKIILNTQLFDQLTDLQLLSDINKAHLIMLADSKIIPIKQVSLILHTVLDIEQNNFIAVNEFNDANIGYYLSYEQALINKIGVAVAGNIQIGRSRNDINATLQRLKTRAIYIHLYKALWNLRSSIIQVASHSQDIAMPIYSQYQAAMPGTYAYYLLGVESALASNQYFLKQMVPILNTATLGASAGAGTLFPIRSDITAKLLGFNVTLPHALAAVANRDLELMLLSWVSIVGVNVSRMATDLQLWTTQEFNFIELPDSLCGISSSMPQKKNPYLLEKIKGKSVSILGTLASALAVMHKTPFSNSVEVGTEALISYVFSMEEMLKAIQLLEIIISEGKPIQKNMEQSNLQGLTIATAVAESLCKNNSKFSYRKAHGFVGKTIANAIQNGEEPLEKILGINDTISQNPSDWHLLLEYGNGPGKTSTEKMLEKSNIQLNKDSQFFHKITSDWHNANDLISREIEKLINDHENYNCKI
jgi:argininosuccinate lyase